jgi:hypothetical protein
MHQTNIMTLGHGNKTLPVNDTMYVRRLPCLHWFYHLYASEGICPLDRPCAS